MGITAKKSMFSAERRNIHRIIGLYTYKKRCYKNFRKMKRGLIIQITDQCNLSCQHCIRDKSVNGVKFSYPVFEFILKNAGLYGFNLVHFSGGEPTLNPDLKAMILLTAKSGYYYRMVSNGANFLQIYKILLETKDKLFDIIFSLDGATQKTHDKTRGHGSFFQVMEAINLCHRKRIPFAINTVVTKINYDELPAILYLSKKIGAGFHNLAMMQLTFNNYHLRPSGKQLKELGFEINDNRFESDLMECPFFSLTHLNINLNGEVTFCCNLSNLEGAIEPSSDIVGSIEKLGFQATQAKLIKAQSEFHGSLSAVIRANKWRGLYNGFRCFYCAKYFKKVDEHVFY